MNVGVGDLNEGVEVAAAGRFWLNVVEVPGFIGALDDVGAGAVDGDGIDSGGAFVVKREEFKSEACFVDGSDRLRIFVEDFNIAQDEFGRFERREGNVVEIGGADGDGSAEIF